MGAKIVLHSFNLVFRNLGDALKVSIGPYLLGLGAAAALLIAVGVNLVTFSTEAAAAAGAVTLLALFLALVIVLFVSSWVAVAWHRFVLLEEYPSMIPALQDRPIWPYLGKSILLSLIVVILAIPLSMVTGLLMLPFMSGADPNSTLGGMFAGVVLGTILTWIFLRLGLVLPATSIGHEMSFSESWAATKPYSGMIFVAVLIVTILNIVVSTILAMALGDGLISLILMLIVNWISIMVGLSLLTTLYGMIVEKRDIA